MRRLAQTAPLADLLTGVDLPAGGMEGFLAATDTELLQHARDTAETIYHPFCSARIGAASLLASPLCFGVRSDRG